MWSRSRGVVNSSVWLQGPSGVEVALCVKSRVRLVKPGSGNGCVERIGHGGDGHSALRVGMWSFGRQLRWTLRGRSF